MTPSSRPTFARAARAMSRCSRVWVAMKDVRIRAAPEGTAGGTIALAKTPSSWARKDGLRRIRNLYRSVKVSIYGSVTSVCN